MRLCLFNTTALSATALLSVTLSCHAADSLQNVIGAGAHFSQAVIMGVGASGQAVVGIAAVPLLSVGAVTSAAGAGSVAAGNGAASVATGSPAQGPLPITDETITVTDPAKALQRR